MSIRTSTPPTTSSEAQPSQIEVTASGDRHSLELLYLELRQLAKQNGLEIEYRLTQKNPEG